MAVVTVFLHSNRNLNYIATRYWGIAAIALTMLLFGGMWTLRLWIRKADAYFMWGLNGPYLYKKIENNSAEGNVNCGDSAREVSEEKNFNMWPKDDSCGILAKNVSSLCLSPKNLPEAKLKSFRIILLPEEILRQPNIDFVTLLL